MAANTVIHNVIIIAQFFRRHGRLNITKELELRQRITSLPKEYTEEQLVRFFSVCTQAEKTLFTAFLMTGFREQEMVHLTWSDVNLLFADHTGHSQAQVQLLAQTMGGKRGPCAGTAD